MLGFETKVYLAGIVNFSMLIQHWIDVHFQRFSTPNKTGENSISFERRFNVEKQTSKNC